MRDIESKLAGLVEGTFGRLFRSDVTPAELARGLAREMDGSRRTLRDRTWVADGYDVYLSRSDHRRLGELGAVLTEDLSNGLLLHAREAHYALAHPPRVALRVAAELGSGRYGVHAAFSAERREETPPEVTHDPDPVREPEPVAPAARRTREPEPPVPDAPVPPRPVATPGARPRSGQTVAIPAVLVVVMEGRRVRVGADGAILGRSRESDVVIASAEVSRRHAELRRTEAGWTIADLGSTNGVRVNGTPVTGAQPVAPGDRVELGTLLLRVEAGS